MEQQELIAYLLVTAQLRSYKGAGQLQIIQILHIEICMMTDDEEWMNDTMGRPSFLTQVVSLVLQILSVKNSVWTNLRLADPVIPEQNDHSYIQILLGGR